MGVNRGVPNLPAPRVFATDDERLKYDTRVYDALASLDTRLSAIDTDTSTTTGDSLLENVDPWLFYTNRTGHTIPEPGRYQLVGMVPNTLGVGIGYVPFGYAGGDDGGTRTGVCSTSSALFYENQLETRTNRLVVPRLFVRNTDGVMSSGIASPPIQLDLSDGEYQLSTATGGAWGAYPIIPDPDVSEYPGALETDGFALYWSNTNGDRRAIAMHDSAAVGGPITGTGVAGYIPIWNGTADLTWDAAPLYFDRTNNRLGVGTGAPAVLAEFKAASAILRLSGSDIFTVGDADTRVEFMSFDGAEECGHVGSKDYGDLGPHIELSSTYHVRLISESNGAKHGLTMSTAGHVSIGNGYTALGTYRLHVYDGTNDAIQLARFDGATNNSQRHFIAVRSGSADAQLGTLFNDSGFVGSLTNHGFTIRSNDTDRITVTAGGDVSTSAALTSGTTLTATTLFTAMAGQVVKRTATATTYTVLATDYYIGVTSTAAARTINLEAAATAGAGRVLIIKDESGGAGTNNITIDGNGAETIDGAGTLVIATNYGVATIICSGTAWFTV